MPRRAIPSTTLPAQVRRYFRLQQQELAAYLGISPELVKHIEAGRRTDRTQADAEGRLAGVEAEIAAYTAILAAPGITPDLRRQNETKLRRATDRRDNLTDQGSARGGVARLLAVVDAEQVAAQVAVLTQAQAAVVAHRNTLPA